MCKRKCFYILFSSLFLLTFFTVIGNSGIQLFDKSGYYTTVSSENLSEINNQLSLLKSSSIPEKDAYEGTLLMKKSGLINHAKDKIALFKAGRIKLEAAIANEPENTEYRFLRLIIQEHAPKVVKYRNDTEADSKMIRNNFKKLSLLLQQVMIDYSRKSSVLKNL